MPGTVGRGITLDGLVSSSMDVDEERGRRGGRRERGKPGITRRHFGPRGDLSSSYATRKLVTHDCPVIYALLRAAQDVRELAEAKAWPNEMCGRRMPPLMLSPTCGRVFTTDGNMSRAPDNEGQHRVMKYA